MRKFIYVFSIVMFLTCVGFQTTSLAYTINAFEFSDLYLLRSFELRDLYDIDIIEDSHIYLTLPSFAHANDDVQIVSVPAGEITVSFPEFDIVEFETTIFDFSSKDEDEQTNKLIKAAIAYSALEYSSIYDDSYFQFMHQFDPLKPSTLIGAALAEFSDAIDRILGDNVLFDELCSSDFNSIALFSKNYDYSLEHYHYFFEGSERARIVFKATSKQKISGKETAIPTISPAPTSVPRTAISKENPMLVGQIKRTLNTSINDDTKLSKVKVYAELPIAQEDAWIVDVYLEWERFISDLSVKDMQTILESDSTKLAKLIKEEYYPQKNITVINFFWKDSNSNDSNSIAQYRYVVYPNTISCEEQKGRLYE